jgi:hypothetical protein
MIVPIVKFILYDNLAYKRVYSCGYLSGRKRQTYYAGKTPNLPLTYFTIKLFTPSLLLVILVFDYEPEIRSMNQKRGDEALVSWSW